MTRSISRRGALKSAGALGATAALAKPSILFGQAAIPRVTYVTLATGFNVILTNEPAPDAWPIAGATFILLHKQPQDPVAATEALRFFAWAYAKGGKMAEDLDYVPMPAPVVTAVQKVWAAQIKDASGKPLLGVSH